MVCDNETTGLARGPLFQLYDRTGAKVSGAFVLNPNFTQMECHTVDMDGDEIDEILVLGQETTGTGRGWAVQLYDQSGNYLWCRFLVSNDFENVSIIIPR